MKKHVMSIIVLLALNACGPSAADVAMAEQVAKEEFQRQQQHAAEQQELKNSVINLKASLAAEETKLESIEKFHLLRTSEEKAEQVASQTKIIEELRSKITDIQGKIDN